MCIPLSAGNVSFPQLINITEPSKENAMASMRPRFFLLMGLGILLLLGESCKKDDASPTGPQGTTITLNGFVKDLDGEPISGVSVIVKGLAPTVTSSTGAFAVANVTAPYDIYLILSTQQTAVIYRGLSRTDPTLLYPNITTSSKSATITGTVPGAIGKTTTVVFVSGIHAWSTTANQTTGAFTISPSWRGSTTSFTGKLHVIRWTANTNGLPAQYDAYGSRDLTISAGGTFGSNNFATGDLTDPAELSISGSITLPTTDYALDYKTFYFNFGNALVQFASESGGTLTNDFSYTVPTISGANYAVSAEGFVAAASGSRWTHQTKTGISGGTSGVSLSLSVAPQLNLPAHGGTGIDTTTQFLWAQGGGTGVNLVIIDAAAAGPTFYIFTAGNSTLMPNLSPQGLGLPLSAPYSWRVYRYTPISTIDNIASESFIPLINGNAGDMGGSQSESFSFTTHP
jgi:hypothetical protein